MIKADFYLKGTQFLTKSLQTITREKIQLPRHWTIDHLCYRVESWSAYEKLSQDFLNFSNLLIESEVNGRPISTFRLFEPLVTDQHQIEIVELPAPKTGKIVRQGFEHIEIVCDKTFPELLETFPKWTHDLSGLKKDFNKELEFVFPDFNVKFHQVSLASVIRLEKNEPVMRALRESQVLSILSPFDPLVAGTFPLGLDGPGSDLDILVTMEDSEKLFQLLQSEFEGQQGFNLDFHSEFEVPTLTAKFEVRGIPFEIFAQPIPSVRQRAYRHFLIEERLLQAGGVQWTTLIGNLREKGFKTEPAFAKILGLPGDPYQALLDLYEWDDDRLRNLVARSR